MREIAYKYTGAGIVVDVPARDIYVDETEYHGMVEANIKNSGLLACWVKVERASKKAKDTE